MQILLGCYSYKEEMDYVFFFVYESLSHCNIYNQSVLVAFCIFFTHTNF